MDLSSTKVRRRKHREDRLACSRERALLVVPLLRNRADQRLLLVAQGREGVLRSVFPARGFLEPSYPLSFSFPFDTMQCIFINEDRFQKSMHFSSFFNTSKRIFWRITLEYAVCA